MSASEAYILAGDKVGSQRKFAAKPSSAPDKTGRRRSSKADGLASRPASRAQDHAGATLPDDSGDEAGALGGMATSDEDDSRGRTQHKTRISKSAIAKSAIEQLIDGPDSGSSSDEGGCGSVRKHTTKGRQRRKTPHAPNSASHRGIQIRSRGPAGISKESSQDDSDHSDENAFDESISNFVGAGLSSFQDLMVTAEQFLSSHKRELTLETFQNTFRSMNRKGRTCDMI